MSAVLLAALVSVLAALSILAGTGVARAGDEKIALLIANGTYRDAPAPIRSSAKDAAAFAAVLKLKSFEVLRTQDGTKQEMQFAIDDFLSKIRPGATALFYFNGIGIQSSHQTYLVPIDAGIWSESDIAREGISIDAVVKRMSQQGAKVKIVVVDAAHLNPFERRFRSYSAGLAGIDAPESTLVVLAAAPNNVSRDETEGETLFMSELVKQLDEPGLDVEDAMTRTRIGVSRASGGKEVPWVASSLTVPLYFTPPSRSPPTQGQRPPERPKEPTGEAAAGPGPQPRRDTAIPPGPAQAAPGTTLRDCPECPQLIVLPPGDFMMGSGKTPYDRPVHKVMIAKPFAIGRTEVTFADWDLCVTDGGCKYRPDDQGSRGGDRPVINVSWLDTKDYIAWLSRKAGKVYRLPSEAEWEYAAHGATTTAFSWGNELAGRRANCSECGNDFDGRQTVAVGSFAANGYGLYDMAGNAAEWVEDCWNASYRGAPRDGSAMVTGECGQRVLRGGSFGSPAAYIKPTSRFRYDADVRYWANGFRLVREVP